MIEERLMPLYVSYFNNTKRLADIVELTVPSIICLNVYEMLVSAKKLVKIEDLEREMKLELINESKGILPVKKACRILHTLKYYGIATEVDK